MASRRFGIHRAACALPLFVAGVAWADEECAPSEVFVISGGISQGAYQAGQLYVFTQWLRHRASLGGTRTNEDPREECVPRVVLTGASAGSLNALLMTAELARNGTRTDHSAPEDSLFWRAWVPAGVDHSDATLLPDRKEATDHAWLVDTTFADNAIGALDLVSEPVHGFAPWPGSIDLGFALTRLVPLTGSGEESVQAVTEAVAWSWTAKSGDSPFRATRLRWDSDGTLEAQPGGSYGWDLVGDAALASASFPIAIRPRDPFSCDEFMDVSYWPHGPKGAGQDRGSYCPTQQQSGELTGPAFIDGGFYDNNPVRLADELARAREPRSASGSMFFLDPGLRPKPNDRYQPDDHPTLRLLEVAKVLGTFRDQNTAQWVLQDGGGHSLDPVMVDSTPASTNLGAFFGFYERTIRAADFYQGMRDAWSHLERHEAAQIGVGGTALKSDVFGSALASWVEGQPVVDLDTTFESCKSRKHPRFDNCRYKALSGLVDSSLDLPPSGGEPIFEESNALGNSADRWRRGSAAEVRQNLAVLVTVSRVQSAMTKAGITERTLPQPTTDWYFAQLDRTLKAPGKSSARAKFRANDLKRPPWSGSTSARIRATTYDAMRRVFAPENGLIRANPAEEPGPTVNRGAASFLRRGGRWVLRPLLGPPIEGYYYGSGLPASSAGAVQLGHGWEGSLLQKGVVGDHVMARLHVGWGGLPADDDVPWFASLGGRAGLGLSVRSRRVPLFFGRGVVAGLSPAVLDVEVRSVAGNPYVTWSPEVSLTGASLLSLALSYDFWSRSGTFSEDFEVERLRLSVGIRAF